MTTGFGDLATRFIAPADAERLQENLLMSHAAGVGEPLPREIVRAMLLLRANTLALGHSGCRPLLVDRLLGLPRRRAPSGRPGAGLRGRVRRPRAAGPSRPAADRPRARSSSTASTCPALVALREVGLEPLVLEAKEGLALLNGTQLMTAHRGAAPRATPIAWPGRRASRRRCRVEALLGTDVAFAAAYQLARPHPGQIAVAAELRHLLRDSGFQAAHKATSHKVQDPYSLRCVPQVHGAVRDALDHLRRVLDIEMNSATDNPLVFPEGGVAAEDAMATGGGRVISGGNFHGEPIALALDFAKLAIAELGSISERRTALLLDPRLNGGLPPFLAPSSGLDSGLMIAQYTAAALASENKVLAHPASVDSIPTSANQEDHVSMGPIAARHARTVLEHVERIVAIELRVAAEAIDHRRRLLADEAAGSAAPPRRAPAPGAGVAEAQRPDPGRRAAARRRPRARARTSPP